MPETAMPPLMQYRTIEDYKPAYGDFIIWTGWITTWTGIVTNYNSTKDELSIILSGIPYVLFTMTDEEQKTETKIIKLTKIQSAIKGTWAILQHDYKSNANIWYI